MPHGKEQAGRPGAIDIAPGDEQDILRHLVSEGVANALQVLRDDEDDAPAAGAEFIEALLELAVLQGHLRETAVSDVKRPLVEKRAQKAVGADAGPCMNAAGCRIGRRVAAQDCLVVEHSRVEADGE